MRSSTILRMASMVSLLYCVGHTMGIPWMPANDPKGRALVQTMKIFRFDIMGVSRTYWDFYLGFGIIISVFLLAQSALLWQLATLAKTHAARLRPILATFLLASVANAILGWRFFFAIPVVMGLVIACFLVWAYVAARTEQ